MSAQDVARPDFAIMAEADLVRRARGGEHGAFRAIMQRGNQRLFRVARGIVRDEAEAEDVLQEAYVRAFTGLAHFRGDASIFTWLTRIVVNEANGRLRKRRNEVAVEEVEAVQSMGAHVIMFPNADASANPEEDVARMQVRRVIERAVDELPHDFRTVFILRDIEDCSVAETAAMLDIREETVKTRLHRARRQLRATLNTSFATTLGDAFPFLGRRCERITEVVLARLAKPPGDPLVK
ncbi:MAG: RNA polymerase sigma factor [Hyphomonadaceae bacterium]|nr:RNA polymerase sigma factor [Hyphomonadaceae bacterium]